MKTYLMILWVLIFFSACSNDFLHPEPINIKQGNDTLWLDQSNKDYVFSLGISLPNAENKSYRIVQYPATIEMNDKIGNVKNGKIEVAVKTNYQIENAISNGIRESALVFNIEGIGYVSFPVFYARKGFSTSELTFNEQSIVFDTETQKIFSFVNGTNKMINWQITEMPEWLTASNQQSFIYPNQTETITFHLNISMSTPGYYSGKIVITTIVPYKQYRFDVSINIEVQTNPDKIDEIEGTVVDADFDQETDHLFLLTQAPNRLVILDTKNGTKEKIELDRIPTCMALLPGNTSAVIGYSVAMVDLVDFKEKKVEKEFIINAIPFDIAAGNGNMCYVSPLDAQWAKIIYIDVATGSVSENVDWLDFYGKSYLIFLPHMDKLVAQPRDHYNGPTVFEIKNDTVFKQNNTLLKDIDGRIWFTRDAKFAFSRNKNIFMANINDINKLSMTHFGTINCDYPYLASVHESYNGERVYISSYSPWEENIASSYVTVYNMKTYTETRRIYPLTLSLNTGIQLGENIFYVFTNKNESKLFMINNLHKSHGGQKWYLERFDL